MRGAFVVPLDAGEALDPALVGGKGANLARLIAAGLPVPPGFVVTTDGYRAHLAEAGIAERLPSLFDGAPAAEIDARSAEARSLIESHPVPATVAAAVREAYEALGVGGAGPVRVSVRSSATAEDLAEASFAGQQDTYLNVRGGDGVLEHVRRCWASLWTARAVWYRREHGFAHESVTLAVVVQQMVDAETAGVMFTANPVTGRRDETVINASYGLGEAVVGGLVTPDTYIVQPRTGRVRERDIAEKTVEVVPDADGVVQRAVEAPRSTAAAIDDERARELARLGARVAEHYGTPQDVEWALAGGRAYVLQSRPITTLGPLPAYDPADHWTRAIFIEILPDAPSPVFCSVLVPILTGMLDFTFTHLGRRPPKDIPGVAVFYHQPYFNLRYIRAALAGLPRETAESFADRIANPFSHGGRAGGRHVPRPSELALLWNTARSAHRVPESLPAVIDAYHRELREMESRDPARLAEEDLIPAVRHLAYDVLPRLVEWDFLLIAALGFVLRIGEAMARRSGVGDPDHLAGVLRSGLTGNVTMATNVALWELGRLARSEPAVARALMEPGDVGLADRIRRAAGHGPFARAMADVLGRYGHREVRMDILYPTWGEDPTPLLRFVRAYVAAGDGPSPREQEAALAEARRATALRVEEALGRGAMGRLAYRRLFRWAMERAEALGAHRDTMHFEWTRSFPVLRRWVEVIGDRWVARGVLARRDDVYFLSIDDLTDWLGHRRPLADLAASNRRTWERDRRRQWPVEVVGGEEVYAETAVGLAVGRAALHGVPGSPGLATGPARIVRGPEDFGRLRAGDVLVAPITNPVWTPLFAIACAVVTDVGGILSHGAIVAREYGIPAVMGAAGATAALRDGQRVTVDGTAGLVTVEEP